MFSLNVDFTSSDGGDLFFVWCRLGDAWPTNFYVRPATPSANARIFGTNGEVVTGTLKANTVYMLELFAEGVDRYQLVNINGKAITTSFATKSIKTYSASIYGSVSADCGTEGLGFRKNEVVKRLDTETVSDVWNDAQPTSNVKRPSWLAKVNATAGQKVKIRFALSQDFTTQAMLFYVWGYNVVDGVNNGTGNGSVTYAGTGSYGHAVITDEDGNAVTQINAYQVYVLELYAENTDMYHIGNFVAEGMTTYFGDVSYEEYVA